MYINITLYNLLSLCRFRPTGIKLILFIVGLYSEIQQFLYIFSKVYVVTLCFLLPHRALGEGNVLNFLYKIFKTAHDIYSVFMI